MSLIKADVNGKNITLNLGPTASIETTNIAGSQNVVTGTGDLGECTIAEGSSASVQVPGAAVEGNNTYQPIVSAPSAGSGAGTATPTPTTTPTPTPATTPTPITIEANKCTAWGIWNVAESKQDQNPAAVDGTVSWTIVDNYSEFQFTLPTTYSLAQYTKATVNFTTSEPVAVKVWPRYDQQQLKSGETYNTEYVISYGENGGSVVLDLTTGSSEYAVIDYTTLEIAYIGFMTHLGNSATVTFQSVTFE